MDKIRQEKLEQRRQKENALFNKLLIWLGAIILYEIIILVIKRYMVNFDEYSLAAINFALGIAHTLGVVQFVAPALTVAAGVWYGYRRKQGKPTKGAAVCTGVFAALSVLAIVANNSRDLGVNALVMAGPAAAVLVLVYFLYQREFFCNTVLTGMGIAALWVYRRAFTSYPTLVYFGFIVVWILLAAAVVLAWKLSRRQGRLGAVQVLPDKTKYALTYASAAASALALVLTLVSGATLAYYVIFILIAWLFCMAVYYTVRMM